MKKGIMPRGFGFLFIIIMVVSLFGATRITASAVGVSTV